MSKREWVVCLCLRECFQKKILNLLHNTDSCGAHSLEGQFLIVLVVPYFHRLNKNNNLTYRFNDISVAIRTKCVQYSMHFLLNHPELRQDVTETLKLRQHDAEESVR